MTSRRRSWRLQPYRPACWPLDEISHLLFVLAFGALVLMAGPFAALVGQDRRAGLLKHALLGAGMLGVVSNLLYVGATKVTIDQQYCDCGFRVQESISQFWAINIAHGGSQWLGYGALIFSAIALLLSAAILANRGLPAIWRWLSIGAAILLLLGNHRVAAI